MGTSRGWVMYGMDAPAPAGLAAADEGELTPELADVRRLARRAVRGMIRAARKQEATAPVTLSSLLHDHLGSGPDHDLPVVEESWRSYDHVNVQAALDAWLAEPGRTHQIVGVIGFQHRQFGLADLLADDELNHAVHGLRPGNVARNNQASGPGGQTMPCVKCAVYLVNEPGQSTAMLVRGADPDSGMNAVSVQIVSTSSAAAASIASRLRDLALEHNVFRGHVLSFGGEMFGHGHTLMQFHPRPRMQAGELILPEQVLAAVQRQVVQVAQHKRRLLRAGQHLKRRLLLYGPPGVGKTHTVRYLTSALAGTTVIQLTGNALHLIGEACSVARTLQPTMLIVEDVDLIAEDRGEHPGHNPMLFQLLNEMDGLAEDADVVFVLTTNRADLLEPALAARPGRVDQAVELTLPDGPARRRLFELYRGTLEVDVARLDAVIERTAGVTASFLKELLRRSALLAASRLPADDTDDAAAPLQVSADDLDAALAELLDTRNAMTRLLLGGGTARRIGPVPAVSPDGLA